MLKCCIIIVSAGIEENLLAFWRVRYGEVVKAKPPQEAVKGNF